MLQVILSPDADPPVVKIMDYKYKFLFLFFRYKHYSFRLHDYISVQRGKESKINSCRLKG